METLQSVFDITPDDLAANRSGNLSATQYARLARAWRSFRLMAIGLVLIGIIALIANAINFAVTGGTLSLVGLVFLAALFVPLGIALWDEWQVRVADLQARRVLGVQGRIVPQKRQSLRTQHFLVLHNPTPIIGDFNELPETLDFKVSAHIFATVQAHEHYRVYATPYLTHVVAMEQVEDA